MNNCKYYMSIKDGFLAKINTKYPTLAMTIYIRISLDYYSIINDFDPRITERSRTSPKKWYKIIRDIIIRHKMTTYK